MTAFTFTIDVPDNKVDDLKTALEGVEIRFDPDRQLIAFQESLMESCVAMGHHTPNLVQEINRQLKEAGLTPMVPTDHEDWTLDRRMAFLEFAISNFDWIDNDIKSAWWRHDGQNWEEIVAEHSLVFTGAAG